MDTPVVVAPKRYFNVSYIVINTASSTAYGNVIITCPTFPSHGMVTSMVEGTVKRNHPSRALINVFIMSFGEFTEEQASIWSTPLTPEEGAKIVQLVTQADEIPVETVDKK
jgi:hypothetical protein